MSINNKTENRNSSINNAIKIIKHWGVSNILTIVIAAICSIKWAGGKYENIMSAIFANDKKNQLIEQQNNSNYSLIKEIKENDIKLEERLRKIEQSYCIKK